MPYDLRFGDVRSNWGQGCIDRLTALVPGPTRAEWQFVESEMPTGHQLIAWAPDGTLYVWSPVENSTGCDGTWHRFDPPASR